MPVIRLYQPSDRSEWLRMRCALWPEDLALESERDADAWLRRADGVVIVAEAGQEGRLAGFAEAGERAYADGCDSSPVAFLEALYVEPGSRGQALGSALVRAVEGWARARGLVELASDCLLENTAGQAVHRAVGFEEVERSVKYRKLLHDA